MTTLICGDKRYQVTTDDRLWLLRAVEAEGPVSNEVAQTLVNCFALEHSLGHIDTLERLVRSYAQPINPRWYPDGDLFAQWHARNPERYTLAAAESRLAKSARVAFSTSTQVAVERALSAGPVDIPACCTDYAAPGLDASHKYAEVTPPGHPRAANRLWTRAPKWQGYRVEQPSQD